MSVTETPKPWWERFISKSSFANISATVLVIGGYAYAYTTQNSDLMLLLVGAGIGYLFGAKALPKPTA